MATLTSVFRAASSAQQGGAETPPSPSQLTTPAAIAPSVESQMEQLVHALEAQLGQARGDPQQEAPFKEVTGGGVNQEELNIIAIRAGFKNAFELKEELQRQKDAEGITSPSKSAVYSIMLFVLF